MTELVPTSPRPLAIDKRGRAFQVPDSATEWLVLENTGGRPRNIEDEDGHPTIIPIDADIDDLAQVVGDETELILVPRDISGKKLPMRAHVSLTPDAMGGWQSARPAGDMDSTMVMAAMQHMFSLNNRLIAVTESNAMVFHNAMKTMADAVTELQRGSVSMLEAANTTIKVANGVEALEREPAPQVDVEDLAEQLEDTIIAELKDKSNQPAWVPFATMAFQGLISFAKTYLASDQGKADAAKMNAATASAGKAATRPEPEAKPAEPVAQAKPAEAKPAEPVAQAKPAEAKPEPEAKTPEAEPTEADADVAADGEKSADAEARAARGTQPDRVTASATQHEAEHAEPRVPAEPNHPAPQATAPADQPSSTTPRDPPNKDDPDAPTPTTQ